MAIYGATRDDPLGWRAIAEGRSAEDPLGWAQIARNQQQPNFGGISDPNLLYALSGALTPDDYFMGQQEQPVDPATQFIDSYGGNYLDQAMGMGQAMGVDLQDPKYRGDDYRALEKTLADRAIKGAGAAYDVSQDQFGNDIDMQRLQLAQGAAGRDERQSAVEFGDPMDDLMFLDSIGMPVQDILAGLDEDPTGSYDAISKALGITNENGEPGYLHNAGINRLMGIVKAAQSTSQQMAQAQPEGMDEATRWGKLDQNQRAKELYLGMTGEGGKHDMQGNWYSGNDAAQRIAQVERNRTRTIPGMGSKPKSWRDNPDYIKSQKTGSIGKDWEQNKFGMRNLVSPGASVAKWAADKGPKKAGKIISYFNPWD